MLVSRLDHLNMSVTDFAATADWYRRVFGFQIVETGTDNGQPWGILRSGDALLCIYQHPELAPITGEKQTAAGIHRVAHFGLRISDRAAFEATVTRENIHVEYGGAFRWPASTAWYITDPNGYEIEVALWDDNRISFAHAARTA